jgi:hypothetical protein
MAVNRSKFKRFLLCEIPRTATGKGQKFRIFNRSQAMIIEKVEAIPYKIPYIKPLEFATGGCRTDN